MLSFILWTNQRVDSYSVAASIADESFAGIPGTEWADRPGYRIELRDHTKITPPIDREQFLGENSDYRPLIRELLDSETGLFFNREFNLNQGVSYIGAFEACSDFERHPHEANRAAA